MMWSILFIREGFLSLGTMAIWGWVSLCCGGLFCEQWDALVTSPDSTH